MKMLHALSAAALAATVFAAPPARAAESFDACEGRYITSLPALVTSAGTYCLNTDLGSGMSSGNAIDVRVTNVTIDCNGHRLNNLTAGPGSLAVGIRSTKDGTRVQNCHTRGFQYGVWLSGNRPEVFDNRFEGATRAGVYVSGDASLVERNRIYNTGGTLGSPTGIVLAAPGEVRDNDIENVYYLGDGVGAVYGIRVHYATQSIIEGNTVRGLVAQDGWTQFGIWINDSSRVMVLGNRLMSTAIPSNSAAINCGGGATWVMSDGNRITGFGAGTTGWCGTPTDEIAE